MNNSYTSLVNQTFHFPQPGFDINDNGYLQFNDLDLNTTQVSLIRKVWEIGTEQVVLQTVIHADGDITSRISERLLQKPNPVLFQIHHESVQGAVGFWINIVETIGKMAANFFQSKVLKK
jgi:hypothetical protein